MNCQQTTTVGRCNYIQSLQSWKCWFLYQSHKFVQVLQLHECDIFSNYHQLTESKRTAPQIQLWCWQCAPYKCYYYIIKDFSDHSTFSSSNAAPLHLSSPSNSLISVHSGLLMYTIISNQKISQHSLCRVESRAAFTSSFKEDATSMACNLFTSKHFHHLH